MDVIQILTELGTSGLIIIVLLIVFRRDAKKQEAHAVERAQQMEERQGYLAVISNHLTEDAAAKVQLAETLGEMNVLLELLTARLRDPKTGEIPS